ncbi:hypothetical protein BGZ73_007145 [Actinomortierella ambigua]|nr:hypothetical protein BGZ73_007145 [Actinomortierella ambigua]
MRLSTALLVLASAAVALAQQAIVSTGIVIARDDSDPNAEGAEIFKHTRNHVVATGSILRRAAQSSRYEPSKQSPSRTRAGFYEFQVKATSFLGFEENRPLKKKLKLEGGIRNLEEAIKKAYDTYEINLIAKKLVELIPDRNQKPHIKQFVLSLDTINKRNAWNHVETKLINLAINLETDENGRVHVPEQNAYLYVRHLTVDSEYLKENADKLAQNIEKATASDFQAYFTSRNVFLAEEGWFDLE